MTENMFKAYKNIFDGLKMFLNNRKHFCRLETCFRSNCYTIIELSYIAEGTF